MKRYVKPFLILTCLVSVPCFGLPLYWRRSFQELLAGPIGCALFALGCLGPVLAAGLVYWLYRKELGGLPALWQQVCAPGRPACWGLLLLFLALHYGLAALLHTVTDYMPPSALLFYFPLLFLLLGSQEIGWRLILQPALLEGRGFWKATIATGLFVSLWFLPLLLLPGFVVRADRYLQFAVYLVGLNLLQTTLRRQGASMLACMTFSGLFYALGMVIRLRQDDWLMAVAAVDLAVAFLYNSQVVRENT